MSRARVLTTFVLLAALAGPLGVAGTRGPSACAEDEERPSLVRALFLEKTARDTAGALALFDRVAADAAADPATRAEARFGAARCLVALGRDADADARLRAVEDDPDAPLDARARARDLRRARAEAQRSAEDTEAELRAQEAVRRAEQARQDREGRLDAARVLVESATRQVKEKRYERAREDLIQALQLNPADERAVALLEEISAYGDRGDLLRQAIRFVATNRVLDFRRLSADVERRHKAALRLLREGKPDLAVASLSDAVARIDESDFYADLAEARRGLVVLMRKAIEDAKRAGVALPAGTAVPADRPEAPAVKPWRSEFFGLLSRVFSSDGDGATALRFYDTAVPPNPAPEARGAGFASSGVSATPAPGTLRRARFVERYVRDHVAPGSWTGRDRLLERYDDLVVVEHAPGALREVDAIVGAFTSGAPAPVRVEVRVYAATAIGVADAVRLLEVRAKPGEAGTSAVVASPTLAEQVQFLAGSSGLVPMAQASLRLTGRHATMLRFREPTSGCPWYANREGPTPLVIPDRDATYGLDLDLYAEDLPGAKGHAAVSVVATVRRPERPRLLPLASGNTRVPSFLTQVVEADRRVPHAGALVLLALANPFKANGAAGDPAGGSHPDLVVLLSVAPADGAGVPDAPPPPTPSAAGGGVTREIDLGPLADVEDEPPPDDWPSAPFADPTRLDAARRRRDAFLASWLGARLGLAQGAGSVVVSDGRVTATLSAEDHARLVTEVARLTADAGRLFTVEVESTEFPTPRALAALKDAGQRVDDPGQRLWRLDQAAAARLAARLAEPASPGVFSTRTRLAARHTQLVTARALRARSIVEEFRVQRHADGTLRTVPVNGTAEEGLVVSVRPVASVGGLATLDVSAVVATIDTLETWSPPDAPGGAPSVVLPRHVVERAGGQGTFGDTDTIVLAVPTPGSDGARTVVVRVRHVKP
jgi:tetratricopeptide (TPR) repeat protein